MEVKWVSDETVNSFNKGRSGGYLVSVFRELLVELKKNPNAWAEFPIKVNGNAWVHHMKKTHKGVQARVTGGNHLAANHPNKKLWTVYFRYVGEQDE